MITLREKLIIAHLIKRGNPTTSNQLAKKFAVSNRTIKNDIRKLREWLKGHDVSIQSQTNKGYWIHFSNKTSELYFHQMLMTELESEEKWSASGRTNRFILLLCLHPEKVLTALQLAEALSVSRNTILNGISEVERVLKQRNVSLQKSSGTGYEITGEELAIRQTIESILLLNNDQELTYRNISVEKVKHKLLSLPEGIHPYIQLVFEMIDAESMDYQPTRSEKYTLYIRILISLCRVVKQKRIKVEEDNVLPGKNVSPLAKYTYRKMDKIYLKVGQVLTEAEFYYVYRNLVKRHRPEMLSDYTNRIINFVSEKEGIPFYLDPALQTNLFNHLSIKFDDNHIKLLEVNPFIEELKKQHANLFEHVQEACMKYLQQGLITHPEFFASFVSLHFLVSMESKFHSQSPIKALYVCASGGGVARIIKNRVEKEIPTLQVTRYCGLDEVEEVLANENYDIVISIFPIIIEHPMILVEPVLTSRNIREIKQLLDQLRMKVNNDATKEIELSQRKHISPMDAESVSLEVIIQGMEFYLYMKDSLGDSVKPSLEDAFLTHIFLMQHRIYFEQEYDDFIDSKKYLNERFKMVKEILDKYGMSVPSNEIQAITYYLEDEGRG